MTKILDDIPLLIIGIKDILKSGVFFQFSSLLPPSELNNSNICSPTNFGHFLNCLDITTPDCFYVYNLLHLKKLQLSLYYLCSKLIIKTMPTFLGRDEKSQQDKMHRNFKGSPGIKEDLFIY